MKIAIVAGAEALPLIKKSFESQRCVGVEFEYYLDVNEIITSIETRGFYLDKLAIVTSFLQEWGEIDKQTLVNRLLNICEHLQANAEIYLVDSKQLLRSEYSNLLSVYPQVKYQPQQIRLSELFGVVMGDLKHEQVDNIDETVKPKGFFSRRFGRKSAQPEVGEDTALITDTEVPVTESAPTPIQEPVTEEPEDLFNLFEENPEASASDVGVAMEDMDDTPLFQEPASTPVSIHEPTPVSAPISEPLPDSISFSDDWDEPMPIPTPKPTPEPTPVVAPAEDTAPAKPKGKTKLLIKEPEPPLAAPHKTIKPQKIPTPKPAKVKSDYISIFQKRTKIILCTGDRRTGISTVASNLAQQAANDGLAVLVMDLDFERKGQAINFPFEADENDTQMSFSIFRAASAPSNIVDYAIHLEDGLDFIGTAISVSEVENIHKAVTDDVVKQMLSSALSAYDLIFIDCPFEYLKEYSSVVAMSHIIVHSMSTDYRGILNTLNRLTPDDFENDMIYNLYLSKVLLLLNNFVSHFWNSTEINEKTITNYMCVLTGEDFYRGIDVIGRVPCFPDYDHFMDTGTLFVNDKRYKNIFVQLLNDLAVRG